MLLFLVTAGLSICLAVGVPECHWQAAQRRQSTVCNRGPSVHVSLGVFSQVGNGKVWGGCCSQFSVYPGVARPLPLGVGNRGPWVHVSPQGIYAAGWKGQAEPGMVTELVWF